MQWPARNGAPIISAPSPSFSPFRYAALRSRRRPPKLAPALRCARQGAGLASTAARTRQSLRLVPRGGSANPAPVGRPAAAVAFAPCGPVRMAGRSRETARLGFVYSAARAPTNCVPLRTPARTPPLHSGSDGLRCASPTVPAKCALLEHPRANHSAPLRSLRLALLVAATVRALRCAAVANRPASASLRPVARRLARRANQNQPLRKKLMAEISPQTRPVLNGPRLPFLR